MATQRSEASFMPCPNRDRPRAAKASRGNQAQPSRAGEEGVSNGLSTAANAQVGPNGPLRSMTGGSRVASRIEDLRPPSRAALKCRASLETALKILEGARGPAPRLIARPG